jgi:hypothetical protein
MWSGMETSQRMKSEHDIVYMRHLRDLGYCAKGVRAFCCRHSLDFGRFLRDGIAADELLAMNDAMATAAVNYMRQTDGK